MEVDAYLVLVYIHIFSGAIIYIYIFIFIFIFIYVCACVHFVQSLSAFEHRTCDTCISMAVLGCHTDKAGMFRCLAF